MSEKNIFIVNPGSTSTKLAFYAGRERCDSEAIYHDTEFLKGFPDVWAQLSFRTQVARIWIRQRADRVDVVAGPGGLLRPVSGGAYRVNEAMLRDARENFQGEHVSNLSCAIVSALAMEYGCEGLIVDPVSVDEFEPLARYSGHPLIERRSLSHSLNIHAAARRGSLECNIPLTMSRFVIAHLGGGISVAAVKGGRIIDVNDAASGGPFSPERTGSLPLQQFITLCFSGAYNQSEVRSLVMGKGGLVSYLGTNSVREAEEMMRSGNDHASEVLEAMAYQIAKEIGCMAAVLEGKLDGIVLTGGVSGSEVLVQWIRQRVMWLGNVLIYPGEDELDTLAETALRILKQEEPILEYSEG